MVVGVDAVFLAEDNIRIAVNGEVMRAHRGRRARHVRVGSPGTWEVLSSPSSTSGRAAADPVQAHERRAPRAWERTSEHNDGTAERRQRSKVGRTAGSRSSS